MLLIVQFFLLVLLGQKLVGSSILLEEVLFESDNENEENDLSINKGSVNEKITMKDSNASPFIECISQEIFREYEPFCYKQSYGRGVGHFLDACPDDAPDQSGFICYPKCQDGYLGTGPMCWQDCTPMKNVGIFCVDGNTIKSSYHGDDDDTNTSSALVGSYARMFIRKNYGRGVGTPMICSSKYEQSGAFCYDYCDKRYYGIGPVCWQFCPVNQPISCFGFGCAMTSSDCAKVISGMFISIAEMARMILYRTISTLLEIITIILIESANRNDWIAVAGNMSILADKFTNTILPDISKKCGDGSSDMILSATKNVSLQLAVASFNDTAILKPYTLRFDIFDVIKAFDHALCNLRDNDLNHSLN